MPRQCKALPLSAIITVYKVKSTYKVLADKAMNHDSGEDWVDWAIEMIESGYENDHLYVLAGLSFPYNIFQVHELAEKAFDELGIERPSGDNAIIGYAYYLISEAVSGKLEYSLVLKNLKDICVNLDYYVPLYSFYLLYFAYEDLKHQSVQFYWPDADHDNINSVVEKEFRNWIERFKINSFNSA